MSILLFAWPVTTFRVQAVLDTEHTATAQMTALTMTAALA